MLAASLIMHMVKAAVVCDAGALAISLHLRANQLDMLQPVRSIHTTSSINQHAVQVASADST